MASLSAHFTEEELRGVGAPVDVRANLSTLARMLLEPLRAMLGVPIRVTSGYRPPDRNAAVGGSETSQHMDGTAADISPVGLSLAEVARRIDAAERAGVMPPYGQLIYYPYTTGHVHISLATRGKRGEKLVKLGGESGGYAKFSLGTFPADSPSAQTALAVDEQKLPIAALVAVLVLAFVLSRK
jgi:zinc D-Ala-D-Ala carboxypeptidase